MSSSLAPLSPALSLTNQTKFTRDTSVVFCLFFIEFLLVLEVENKKFLTKMERRYALNFYTICNCQFEKIKLDICFVCEEKIRIFWLMKNIVLSGLRPGPKWI